MQRELSCTCNTAKVLMSRVRLCLAVCLQQIAKEVQETVHVAQQSGAAVP